MALINLSNFATLKRPTSLIGQLDGNVRRIERTGLSDDDNINSILWGTKWSSKEITYSFPSYGLQYTDFQRTFSGMVTLKQQNAVRSILDADTVNYASKGFTVEGFTDLHISRNVDGLLNPTLRIMQSGNLPAPAKAEGYYPGMLGGGNIFLGTQTGVADLSNPQPGNYAWFAVMHEVGHALGLKHSFEIGTYNATIKPRATDSFEYSVMTYYDHPANDGLDWYFNRADSAPQTYMRDDIAALQYLYGADYSTNSDNTVYSWRPDSGQTFVNGQVGINASGGKIFATIWDGGGEDTYDLSAYSNDVVINLIPGTSSTFAGYQLADLGNGHSASGNVYNAYLHNNDSRSLIENAIGGRGDDWIIGNDANNVLTGNDGNDRYFGLGGDDTFVISRYGRDTVDGGSGDDTLSFSKFERNVDVDLAAGAVSFKDLFFFSWQAQFLEVGGVEFRLIENLTGSAYNDSLYGDDYENEIRGMGGDDTLYGRGGNDRFYDFEGINSIDGGDDYDTLYVPFGFDQSIVQQDSAGAWCVYTDFGTSILTNIEAVQFTDSRIDLAGMT